MNDEGNGGKVKLSNYYICAWTILPASQATAYTDSSLFYPILKCRGCIKKLYFTNVKKFSSKVFAHPGM